MRRLNILILIFACGWTTIHAATRVDAQQIVATAKQYLGCPYSYGATGPSRFDCSGFVQFCFDKHNIRLPRNSAAQSGEGERVTGGWDNLQTGDLVFFGSSRVSHVGIYVGTPAAGQHQFIHAATSKGVSIATLEDPYWKKRFLFAKRLELVESEPIVIPKSPKTGQSASNAPQTALGQGFSRADERVDDVVPYKTKKWKTKVNRRTRVKTTWKD